MKITIIAAMTRNGQVIGKEGSLPWRIREDLIRFKELTMGATVVMGRKTWDSLPKKPLPGRNNFIITRNKAIIKQTNELSPQDEYCTKAFAGLEHAIEEAKKLNKEIFIIGGAQIYSAVLDHADKMEITFIEDRFDGDTYFPAVEWDRLHKLDSKPLLTEKGINITFETLVKKI